VTEIDTSPLVLHGRRRSVARLRAGVVLLETDGVRHRIPVAAIARVDATGPGGRVLTVVVATTPTTPTDPVTYSYSLTSRSAPAVRAFAEAVRRALPVRDADEPRPQVSAEPVERSGPHLGYAILGALVLTYVLVAVVLVNRGAGEQAVVYWLAGPMLTGAGGTVLPGGVRTVREAVVLRRRGITVEGRRERSYEVGTGEDAATHHMYAYVDALGNARTRSGRQGGADEVDILYDPEDPEGTTKVGHRTAGHLFLGLFRLVLGLATVSAGLWAMGVGVVALLR
jgi:hypothetical protein